MAGFLGVLGGLALARADGTGHGAAEMRSPDAPGSVAVSPLPAEHEQPSRPATPLTSGRYPIWRVSVASDGTQGNWDSYYPSISADGRFVAFWSQASNLVPGDVDYTLDTFVRDRVRGVTEAVSVPLGRKRTSAAVSGRSVACVN